MLKKLSISLILLFVLCLSACSQETPPATGIETESPISERQEDIVAPSAEEQNDVQTEDAQTADSDENCDDELGDDESASSTDEDALPAGTEEGQGEESQSNDETELSEDEEVPPSEDDLITMEEKDGEAIINIPEGMEIPDELRELLESLERNAELNNNSGNNESSNNNDENDSNGNEDEDENNGYTQTTRTDAEVKAVLDNLVDNFKNTSTFANLTGVAAERIDDILDIIKNNPESDDYLNKYINSYKNGRYTEERFVFMIESWIEVGGPYGTGNNTIQ